MMTSGMSMLLTRITNIDEDGFFFFWFLFSYIDRVVDDRSSRLAGVCECNCFRYLVTSVDESNRWR